MIPPQFAAAFQRDPEHERSHRSEMRRGSTSRVLHAIVVAAILFAWPMPAVGSLREAHTEPPAGEFRLDAATRSRIVESISAERILAEVTHLAGDEFHGRFFRSPMAFTAAEWIRDRFEEAGLRPGVPATLGRATAAEPDETDAGSSEVESESMPVPATTDPGPFWFQPIADPKAAPNVIGVLRASSEARSGRSILVTAHYDHLPPRRSGEDRIHNGADDNASGTCGMIAVARALAGVPGGLPCDVVFIAFTGEEAGLRGARHYVERPTIPLESISALVNLDMISRGDANTIFVDGTEISEPIRAALRVANRSIGLRIRFDEHPEWLERSDQGPFLARGVPSVLFSVEDHEDYHQVTDHADRIIPELAAKVSRLVALAVAEMARSESSTPAVVPPIQPANVPKPMTSGTGDPSR